MSDRALGAEAAGEDRLVAINGLVPVRDRRMLQFLSRSSRVPQSEYLREAIRDLLRKYRDSFDGSPFEDDEPL
ncbi:MAG TPA: ribbon-helix-helix domain-containing protein [bacterium]|nr:ribbon-helix-helix domain-containing protein [bacterium]